jgi:hypothetical protein
MFISLSQDPRLNGEKLLVRALQLMGVDQPEGYIKPPEAMVPASLVEGFLANLNVPAQAFIQWLNVQQQGQGQNGNGAVPAGVGGPTVNGNQGAQMGGAPDGS